MRVITRKPVIALENDALQLIDKTLGASVSQVFIVTYADKPDLIQDWTPLDPVSGLITPIEIKNWDNRRTVLYDGLEIALRHLAARTDPQKKVLIVIGEGNDYGSLARYSEVRTLAVKGNIQCFALLIANHNLMGGRVRHYGFNLCDLSSKTKGDCYDVENSQKNCTNPW